LRVQEHSLHQKNFSTRKVRVIL